MKYLYSCPTCGEFEAEHPMSEVLEDCPRCGDEVRRLISCAPPFVLRGPGWSADGYSKPAKEAATP